MSESLVFNGIDGRTGEYLLPPMTAEQLSDIIRNEPMDEAQTRELKSWLDRIRQGHYGVKEGVDPKDLSQSGWGVIFPHDIAPAIVEALQPLLKWRQEQAGEYFKQYTGGDGYRPNDNKNAWLSRHGVGPGPVDPVKVPYYLLLVGEPGKIPYRFQTQVDVQYGVGRLCFDTVEEYANYAQSVIEAEKQKLRLPRKLSFFGVSNPDDPATRMSAEQLVMPLVETMSGYQEPGLNNWQWNMLLKDEATKARLGNLLGGADTPALLFTASHGMSFPKEDARQFPHQGSLLCQDWPGPGKWRKPIPEDFYFSADDLASDAKLWGLIAFLFACYGAGTPMMDEFAQQAFKDRSTIAPRPFISRLPQRMLSHPKGGALAVVGHVERAWGYSFMWGKAGRQLTVFESALRKLMDGHPIGSAFECFNERYAELSSDLSVELEEISFGKTPDPMDLSGMWTSNNDARNYVILGDPAVRMMVEDGSGNAALERPVITLRSASAGPDNGQGDLPMGAEILTTEPAGPAPVVVQVAPPAASLGGPQAEAIINYGLLDGLQPAAANLGNSLQQLAQKLGQFLTDALTDASTLKVSTYVSTDLNQVDMENGKLTGAQLRALTYIKVDGDTLVCVPERDGEVDTELWRIHLEMVQQAQTSRADLIKAAVSAASGLVNLSGGK